MFKFRAVLTHCQPFLSGSVRKRATNQIQMQKNGQSFINASTKAMPLTVSSEQHRVLQCEVGDGHASTLELKVRAACNTGYNVRP
jgi:hypothetical protein